MSDADRRQVFQAALGLLTEGQARARLLHAQTGDVTGVLEANADIERLISVKAELIVDVE